MLDVVSLQWRSTTDYGLGLEIPQKVNNLISLVGVEPVDLR